MVFTVLLDMCTVHEPPTQHSLMTSYTTALKVITVFAETDFERYPFISTSYVSHKLAAECMSL